MHIPNVKDFRTFTNSIRQPSRYCPIVTEAKGVTNIVFGILELLASQYMKYNSNPDHNRRSRRHVEMGAKTLKTGLLQAAPGFLVSLFAAHLFKKYVKTRN